MVVGLECLCFLGLEFVDHDMGGFLKSLEVLDETSSVCTSQDNGIITTFP